MPVSLCELHQIEAGARHARFYHTNLHVHTPATPWDWDSQPNQTIPAADLTPEIFFEALTKTKLDLVAITDHNCVKWCQPLINLASTARRKGTSNLHILPGVELTTYEGPHVAAIFDEDADMELIRQMLVRLGMSGDGQKDDKVSCKTSGQTITPDAVMAEVIDGLGGLLVAPHVHSEHGLWGNKGFRSRSNCLNDPRLRILAAKSEDIKRIDEGSGHVRLLYKNMDSCEITNSYAFINVSDCHRLDDLEKDTTWIKMSSPSLAGVRQIVYEPELRVCHSLVDTGAVVENPVAVQYSTPKRPSHPYIIGMAVSGGQLDGQAIALSPHLNCLIGKNYAGKTAVLDLIRFALNSVPQEDQAHDKWVDKLQAILTAGGQVRLYLKSGDGKLYGIARTLAVTKAGKSGQKRPSLQSAPEIFMLVGEEFHPQSQLTIDNVFRIEIYPQGEVVKIKDNAFRQMSIVDALANVDAKLADVTKDEAGGERTTRGKLVDNGEQIVRQQTRLAELREQTVNIEPLEAEIQGLEVLVKSPLFAEMQEWADVGNLIDRHKRHLTQLKGSWSKISAKGPDEHEENPSGQEREETGQPVPETSEETRPIDLATATSEQFVLAVERLSAEVMGAARSARTAVVSQIEDALARLEAIESAVTARGDAARIMVAASAKQAGDGTEASLIPIIADKRRDLNALKDKQLEAKNTSTAIEELQEERSALLAQFHAGWEEIRAARQEVVKVIDRSSFEGISAELSERVDTSEFVKVLDDIATRLSSQANKILSKQSQLEAIASGVTPKVLVAIARLGDASALVQRADGVTLNTAKVLMGMSEADIHQLELCVLRDKFVISYRREGDSGFTPVDAGLSGGEQALALISVAMVPKPLPLVIDQPEDELGPALITGALVEQVRSVKSARQLIFVTHVPSIPVCADSELVVCMQQSISSGGRHLRAEHRGSMDHEEIIADLLELDGGELAFKKRSERYRAIGSGRSGATANRSQTA